MKSLVHILAAEAGISTLEQGEGTSLVRVGDADRLLALCAAKGIAVIGIEGFQLSGGNLVPDMSLIADFSELDTLPWNMFCSESLESSRLFVEKAMKNSEILLEFELQSRVSD